MAVLEILVSTLLSVTVAPGIRPPLWSTTTPSTLEVSSCAGGTTTSNEKIKRLTALLLVSRTIGSLLSDNSNPADAKQIVYLNPFGGRRARSPKPTMNPCHARRRRL